jgi:coenzyme F420-0:L-glutamate ligase/coenzyme F420-1:gamma-L-glutamate ligase
VVTNHLMPMHYIIDLIKKRRSIRKYSSRKVERAVVREILRVAQWAPSAHNAQPWRFVVLTDDGLKQDLAEAMANAWVVDMTKDGTSAKVRENRAAASIEQFMLAPVFIVACLTMKNMAKHADELRQKCERDLAVQSLGAALQNMLLVAHAKGLGARWFCAPVFCKDIVRKILKAPMDVEPQALIALGYPAEKPTGPSRKPLKTYAYFDVWGK